jgi:hypothetical protein
LGSFWIPKYSLRKKRKMSGIWRDSTLGGKLRLFHVLIGELPTNLLFPNRKQRGPKTCTKG